MPEDLIWDREKGELRLPERRHTATDAQSLCSHLDSLIGPIVPEVVMNNLEFRLGKEDAERIRKQRPAASVDDMISYLIELDRLSGVGLTKVTFPADPQGPILIERSNPCEGSYRSKDGVSLLLVVWRIERPVGRRT